MKFKVLLTFIALSFFSCSGGDDAANEVDPVADPVPVVEKKLDYVIETLYANGDVSRKRTTKFNNNNQVDTKVETDGSGQIIVKDFFSYDVLNRLVGRNTYSQFQTNIADYEERYYYDEESRVVKKTLLNTSTYTISTTIFKYDGNTITKSYTDNPSFRMNFELNEEGYIVYSANLATTITDKFTYENGNVIWYGGTSHSPDFIYEYDTVNTPVGQYLNINKNQYGSLNNSILINTFYDIKSLSKNYLVKWSVGSGEGLYEFKYEFDELGYPVTDSRYVAGTNIIDRKTEIFYK